MAPVGSTRLAGSSRNLPPPPADTEPFPAEDTEQPDEPNSPSSKVTRIKNAKELREAYIELNQSPDGADPDPMTIPKCVECSHCGWPVFPRQSKIATKKCFARAGIERGTKKEEDAKRRAEKMEKLEKGEDVDVESTDSRDTVERMADELEELRDENETLKERNEALDAQNFVLTKELEETKLSLAEAQDRIEFLEEAELRWRDKVSQGRLEVERLKQVLDRAGMVASDREGGLIKTLEELRIVRQEFAVFVRRRNFMLIELEQQLSSKEKEEYKGIVLRMWRTKAANLKLVRHAEDIEVKRQREVRELNAQLDVEREQVGNLRVQRERLVARLKEAGHRLLRRALGSDAWPSFKDHAFRAFVAMHPVNGLENALEFCQNELEKTNKELEEMTDKAETLEEERDGLKRERERLLEKCQKSADDLAYLKEQIGGSLHEMEARKQEMEDEKTKFKDEIITWKNKLTDTEVEFSEERESFETQIRMLESRLSVAEAVATAKAGGGGDDDDPSRVVPKGQGVVCVSCLKQLVHRTVQPLAPMEALNVTQDRLEQAKKHFFKSELSGIMDSSDELHDKAFKSRKDPYGIARLTLFPPGGAITRPNTSQSPTTGLPALSKKGFANSATSLRISMREFKPRNFR